jgi:hypothetical protein
MNNSNKMPYLLAAGAIGGAIGYLFFTEKGKKMVNNISQMRVEKSARIPEKIDDLRSYLSDRGRNVSGFLRNTVDHLKLSVESGQQGYRDAGGIYKDQVSRLHRSNGEVVGNLHKAVDNLGKLMETVQETFLHPLYELGAVARGVDRGVRELKNFGEKKDNLESMSDFREELRERIIR